MIKVWRIFAAHEQSNPSSQFRDNDMNGDDHHAQKINSYQQEIDFAVQCSLRQ